MNLRCRQIQQVVAQRVAEEHSSVLPPDIAFHLEQCAACRRFQVELMTLQAELSAELPMPVFAEDFTERVLSHLTPQPLCPPHPPSLGGIVPLLPFAKSGRKWRGIALFSLSQSWERVGVRANSPQTWGVRGAVLRWGIVAAVCLLFLLWRPHTPQTEPPKKLPAPVLLATVQKTPSLSQIRKPTAPENRAPVVARREAKPFRVRHRRMVARVHSAKPFRPRFVAWYAPSQPAPVPPEVRSRQWSRWASLCEAHGDYPQAADAYAHAYDALPSEDTAFSAGQAAENAGDVSQALDYYTEILRQPLRSLPQSEKGTGT